MSIQLGSAYGKISIDSSGVDAGIKNATKSLETFGQTAKRIGDSMNKIGNAMTIGLTLPIVAFFASSVKSAMDAESALAEVNAVLKSTGGIAGVTAEEVKKLATEFQKVTKFSDEQVMSGESMLLTFTKIGKNVFPQATEAMLNMAEKFGSVETASIQLGKALNDPVAGVSALRRVGVMLSDQQEKQIKDFMAVNDIASAQKVILKELEVEFGGLAKAAGETTAGKFAQFKNTLDDFKEVIGAAIIPSLIRFMDALTPILIALSELPPGVTDSIIAFLAMVAVAGPLISFLGTLVKILGAFLPGGALAGIGTFFTTTLIPAFTTFFTFITATAIPAIIAFAVANAAWLIPLAAVIALIAILYIAWKNNFGGIKTTLEQSSFLINLWATNTSMAFTKWVDDTSMKFTKWTDENKSKFSKFSDTVKAKFAGVGTTVNQLWFIIKNAFSGIGVAIDWVVAKVNNLKTALLSIKLPPHLTPGSPTPFENGLNGIADAMGNVSQASQNMAASIRAAGVVTRENIKTALQAQLHFFSSYFKDLDELMNQNTKNQNAAMKAQAKATEQSLKAQAEAMKKYLAAAAKFWNGTGIPTSGGSGGGTPSLPDFSEIPGPITVEPIGGITVEQIYATLAKSTKPNELARSLAKPVQNNNSQQSTSTIINLSNGLTLLDVDRMVEEKINRFVKRAMGGA